MGFKDKILDPQTTTSTEFAGDTLNDIADYLSAVDMTQGGAQPSKNVDINTETLFSTGSLKLWDSNKSHKITITQPDYTESKTLSLPSEAALGASDEFLFKDTVATVTGKTMDFTTDNTANNIPSSSLPSSIFYNTADNDAGQHYMDFTQLAGTPSNPPSTVRRLFVDTTGKLSVRTNAGSTIDLETAATGDSGGIAAGGTATFSATGSQNVFNIAHGLSPTPDFADVSAYSSDAIGPFYLTIDATNVVVTYQSAPQTGTSNVVLLWAAGYNTQAEPGFTPSSITTITNKTVGDSLIFDKVTLPSNPGTEQGKLYLKEIDVNNNGLFILIQKGGTIEEVQII